MRSSLAALFVTAVLSNPLAAQRAREWQIHGVAVVAESDFIGGGVGFGLRSWGRMRLGATASAGSVAGALAGRGELSLSYHVNPVLRRGVAPYAGGGAAVTVTDSGTTEYLVLVVGLEASPGRPWGFFAEVGVSGGLRGTAGIRWRRFGRRR
ncbi:MAG: hypothetical protein ACE5PT_08580 [Gemmatimonadales bacterium]